MLYLKLVIFFLGACSCLELNVHPYLRRLKNIRECKSLKIQNGRVRTRTRSIFAQFTCNKGFNLAGERYIKCVKGEWSGTPPICVKIGCKKINQLRNVFIFESYKGAVMDFFCLPGYTLSGTQRLFCDGISWSGQLPNCFASNSTPPLSCDFESDDLCGWTHDLSHDFDWTRRTYNENNNSSTIHTGPKYDHTLGPDVQGHYMHIEASSRQINDTSRLISPIYYLSHPPNKTYALSLLPQEFDTPGFDSHTLTTNQELIDTESPTPNDQFVKLDGMVGENQEKICLSLFYHMSGDGGQQLRVYVNPTRRKWSLIPERALFWISGNYGGGWHKKVLLVGEMDEPFQIIIEGIRGYNFESDIAIDDVSIIEDCNYKEETKDSEKLTTASETIQTESCLNRCYEEKPSNETESFACDCYENCVLNNTCCPDFTAICILGNTEEFATDMSTTELIWTTDDYSKTSGQEVVPEVPNHIKDNENAMDNNINPKIQTKTIPNIIKTASTAMKSTTQKPSTTNMLIKTVPTIKTTTTPVTTPTTKRKTTKLTTTTKSIKVTELDYSLLSDRPDLLLTGASLPEITQHPDEIENFQPESPPIPPKELSKYARITVSNTTSKKQSAVIPQYLVIGGVVCFALVGVVATAAIVRKYALRRCTLLGRGRGGAHGDSQSDVRFLTSDEVLDFTLQRPSDECSTI